MNELSAPPFELLIDVVGALESHEIVCALGGSGLLAALGLGHEVRDWDLTTDAPLDRVLTALEGRVYEHKGTDALHADQLLRLHDGQVEVIVGSSFFVDEQVVRIPTRVTGRWREAPIGSPEGWAVGYTLLGRTEKAERLWGHLERYGADPTAVATLLAQPLPPEVARRLRTLTPPSAATG